MLIVWVYKDYDNTVLLVGGLFHTFFTIPALLLHISYTIKNWGTIIEINDNDFVVTQNGEVRSYKKSDIKSIMLFQSAGLDKWSFPMSAMDYYKYVRLTNVQGENIFITCLMTTRMQDVISQFSSIPYLREKGIAIIRNR